MRAINAKIIGCPNFGKIVIRDLKNDWLSTNHMKKQEEGMAIEFIRIQSCSKMIL
jgi:hypothetical protein